ncbi:ABC transporter substrate-binding protein [Pseudochelatococcus lubricantis]|uniref:ABC transporter substrate-binding protein n=1 Tax=Pseudochelatococcus lubricantis TaxID=1538102 RepID=UPI0035E51C1A
MHRHAITRRAALALAGMAFGNAALARGTAQRIAAIDWAMLETALALGMIPVAATELIQFRRQVIVPAVPDSVTDLGLRGTPNFELLRIVQPDLILISNFYEHMRPLYERIAPVFSATVFRHGEPPYPRAEQVTAALGERLGLADEARNVIDGTRRELAAIRERLSGAERRPVFVVSLGDARHFRAFGDDSLFGNVLGMLGFANAWEGASSYSAAAPVGIEALARVPEARLVVVEPTPPEVRRVLATSALWRALPMVREKRVTFMAPVNHFGALPSARRFAQLLAAPLNGDGSVSDGGRSHG